MKLLYDLKATQPASDIGKRHGGGRYGEMIFYRMVKLDKEFCCCYDSRLWFNPDVKEKIEEKNIPLFDLAERSLQQIVNEEGIERVYSCLLNRDVKLENVEVYATKHDLRGLEVPYDKCFWQYKHSMMEKIKFLIKSKIPAIGDWRDKKYYREICVETKAKFVVVSEHAKYIMLSYFPELKDREIPVFYCPEITAYTDGELKHEAKTVPKSEKAEKYFLAVSGKRWEKNNARAIQAFDCLIDNGLIRDVRMKVTGAKRDDILIDIKHPEAIDFMGYVSDEELEGLYANAYLFVYPSLAEGFGSPPIEALRYHVPVIASPITSIAEVFDSGLLFFNPFSVEEIMSRMLMMMDPERHAEYAERGYQQYLKISERQRRDLDGVIDYITS